MVSVSPDVDRKGRGDPALTADLVDAVNDGHEDPLANAVPVARPAAVGGEHELVDAHKMRQARLPEPARVCGDGGTEASVQIDRLAASGFRVECSTYPDRVAHESHAADGQAPAGSQTPRLSKASQVDRSGIRLLQSSRCAWAHLFSSRLRCCQRRSPC